MPRGPAVSSRWLSLKFVTICCVATLGAGAACEAAPMQAGVNLSGLEFNAGTLPGVPNTDYPVPGDWELWYYQSKGINLVRLPILWERLQPNLLNGPGPHPLDKAYLGLIKTFLGQAYARNMSVIIDLHDYGHYEQHPIGGTYVSQQMFAHFWRLVAHELAHVPGVAAYDLMNEPNGLPSAAVWPAAAQAAVNAIRKVDFATPITVEGDFWASAPAWLTFNATLHIVDPVQPVTYQAHVYGDQDNSGTHFAWSDAAANGVTVQTISQRLAGFIGWCQIQGARCAIGEVGVGNDSPNWNLELANGLATAAAGNMVAFTYWAGGPWWGSYPMSIEPTTPDGVLADAMQMQVVSPYGAPPNDSNRAFSRNTSTAKRGRPNT